MKNKPKLDSSKIFSTILIQSHNTRNNKKHFKLFSISFLLILFLGGGGYWTYKNNVFSLYNFSLGLTESLTMKKSYRNSIKHQETIIKNTKIGEIISQKKLNEFREDYQKLLTSYPGDPILFYYCASLEYRIFAAPLKHSYTILADTFLLQYIDKYKFPNTLSHVAYQNALVFFRKAIALNLPIDKLQDAQYKLNFLYLFSHKSYFSSQNILRNLSKFIDSPNTDYAQELVHLSTTLKTPNWVVLGKYYPVMFITYLKAIYYLRINNRPFGFSLLQDIAKKEVTSIEEEILLGNTLYMMGYIEGVKQKRPKNQFLFYSKIEANRFIQKFDWFFDEYLLLLRFLGKKGEQKKLIAIFQKIEKNKFPKALK